MDSVKIRKVLSNSGFVSEIYCFDEIDSTNTFLKGNDIPFDSFAITEFQANGKGRFKRSWISDKSLNLTFSFKKKFSLSPSGINIIMFYFSYYLYSAIKHYLEKNFPDIDHSPLQIKWPNDILFGWKKLSGILIESKPVSGSYIIGIGINCNQLKFTEEPHAISLVNITENKIDREELLFSIINEFSSNISELENKNSNLLYKNWKKSTKIIGKNCTFSINNDDFNYGNIIDLNEDGSISIQTNEGIQKYLSGEVKITSFK